MRNLCICTHKGIYFVFIIAGNDEQQRTHLVFLFENVQQTLTAILFPTFSVNIKQCTMSF